MSKITIQRLQRCLTGVWLLLVLMSCSSGEESDTQSAIDEAVQKTADKAVHYIKDPINKAEAIKELEEERTRTQDEQLQ